MPTRRRHFTPSPSMAVALVALFVSLGGAGYAATTLSTRGTATRSAHATAAARGPRGRRGPRGPRGLRGLRGVQGVQGIQGAAGGPGAPAVINRSRLDFRSAGLPVSASTTYSQVESVGTVDKLQPGTALRVEVSDTLGLDGGSAGCALQIRVDGANDNGSTATSADTGTEAIIGAFASAEFSAHPVAVFNGLPAGPHSVSLWLRATFLGSNTSICLEGINIDATPLSHTAIVEETS